jgi:hypothetical protein
MGLDAHSSAPDASKDKSPPAISTRSRIPLNPKCEPNSVASMPQPSSATAICSCSI